MKAGVLVGLGEGVGESVGVGVSVGAWGVAERTRRGVGGGGVRLGLLCGSISSGGGFGVELSWARGVQTSGWPPAIEAPP